VTVVIRLPAKVAPAATRRPARVAAARTPARPRARATDDGWETSNQIPGVGGGTTPSRPSTTSGSGAGGDGADGVLDKALEGLDGEILAERAVIRSRANETAGSSTGGAQGTAGAAGSDGRASGGAGAIPGATASMPRMPGGMPSNRTSPPSPPAVAAGPVPEDIEVAARDDDVIARQLREAAMKETDPELREKLWAEYRRYKGM
jgi:hypothetical protein